MKLNYKYVRIQGQELAANTMYAKGIFSMCWQLIQNDVMDEEDVGLFKEIDSWFAENLPWPVVVFFWGVSCHGNPTPLLFERGGVHGLPLGG